MQSTRQTVFYACLFQAGWLCFTLGFKFDVLLGFMAVLALVTVFHATANTRNSFRYSISIILLASCGFGFDVLVDYFNSSAISHSPLLGPAWLWFLWLWFVALYPKVFVWLMNYPVALQSIFGAFGGLVSYLAAAKLGCIEIHSLPYFIGLYSVFWAMVFPLLGWCHRQWQTTDEPGGLPENI